MRLYLTADEVRAFREANGVGIVTTKKVLIGRRLREALKSGAAANPLLLQQILLTILDDVYPEDSRFR